MRIGADQATKMYALVQIDEDAFLSFNDFRASLNVPGYEPDTGLIWQFDGQIYPLDTAKRSGQLLPGEKLWVPLIVAQYGVKQTAMWPLQMVNGLPRPNFLHGAPVPRLKILEIRDPGDFSDRADFVAPRPATPRCPYCDTEVEVVAFAKHIEESHGAEIAQRVAAPQPSSTEEAKRKVEAWAAKAVQE